MKSIRNNRRRRGPYNHTKEAKTMADTKGYIVKTMDTGSINISEEVIITLAAAAAAEVEGVKEPAVGDDNKVRKNLSRYVKADCSPDGIKIDISITLAYGCQLKTVSAAVQENIENKITTVTGIAVKSVNVNVVGVAFEKEKK